MCIGNVQCQGTGSFRHSWQFPKGMLSVAHRRRRTQEQISRYGRRRIHKRNIPLGNRQGQAPAGQDKRMSK